MTANIKNALSILKSLSSEKNDIKDMGKQQTEQPSLKRKKMKKVITFMQINK